MSLAEYHRKRRQRYKKNKMCVNCSRPIVIKGTRCVSCKEKESREAKERYEQRKSKGLCGKCGKSEVADGVSHVTGDKYACCDRCLDYQKEWHAKRALKKPKSDNPDRFRKMIAAAFRP